MIDPLQKLIHLKLISGEIPNEATDLRKYNLSQCSVLKRRLRVSIFTLNAPPHGSSQQLIVGFAFPLFYSSYRVQEKIHQPSWL
jgi:hypothetical protein